MNRRTPGRAVGAARNSGDAIFSRLAGRTATTGAETSNTAPLLLRLSEREFQRIVVDGLKLRGWTVWHVPNMRQTTAGLPDLFCIHANHPIALLWELKAEKTRVTATQQDVIKTLMAVPGVDARILRPSGWDQMRDALDSGLLFRLHREALVRQVLEHVAPRDDAGAGGREG